MKNKIKTLAIGAAMTAAFGMTAHAQSADALIDKLVDKGILTVKEANDLREEADKNFTTAFATKTGMADWVKAMKFNGDLRARYDGVFGRDPSFVDRNRLRYRLRFGFTADMADNFEVALRLTSSEGSGGGDPISGNTTFADNGSKKLVFLDLVYAKWSPIHTPDWTGVFTFGKMENPFVFPSTMMFDKDYTPEGLAAQFGYNINEKHALKFSAGAFVLDETKESSSDPWLGGAQLRWDAKWNSKWSSTAGVAGFAIKSVEELNNVNVPNGNLGNTRRGVEDSLLNGTSTAPQYGFVPIYADAGVTYTFDEFPLYPGAFPLTVSGDFVHNTAAPKDNQGYSIGVTLGKAGKKGTWELAYRWESLEADAWYEEFVESDFGAIYRLPLAPTKTPYGVNGTIYGPGTNVRGHWVKLSYSPYDSLTLGLSCFMTELINPVAAGADSSATRVLADAVWKF